MNKQRGTSDIRRKRWSRAALLALFVIPFCLFFISSCASIGVPDGGRFDEEPPRVVSTTPMDKATGLKSVKKVRITFNEFIKLENASEKVIISPPQEEQPDLYTSGKSVVMTIYDTLQANTTYTIDFGDAIVDNNEANPFGNYTYSFSTGDHIDTLQVSGHVIRADNMEPVKGILVGLYKVDSLWTPDGQCADTLLSTIRLERVSRTDDNGLFSIKGVAEGRYRVYALADMDGDYRFSQKSEMIAFDSLVYVPSTTPDLRHDTVWIDTARYEKVIHTPYTRFLPDDIVLRAFLEEGQAHYLLKTERKDPLKFTLFFTAPSDTVPKIEIVGSDGVPSAEAAERSLVLQPNPTRDTLVYWVADTALAYRDTLAMHVTYLETDSLGYLVPRTDTLDLVPKVSRAKQLRDLESQVDKWVKKQAKLLERYEKKLKRFQEQYPDSVYQYPEQIDTARALCPLYTPEITVSLAPGGAISPTQILRLTSTEPLALVDTAHIKFQHKVDSLWIDTEYMLEPDSLNPCVYTFYAEWEPGETYHFEADSTAFRSIYGWWGKPVKRDVSINPLDVYGSLFINVGGNSSRVIVQLLDKSDKVIREQEADDDGHADFYYLSPGQVYMRCFEDVDGDGKWTTGDYAAGRQPEPVYYFPGSFTIKAKWEMEQNWMIGMSEPLRQKPSALIKQKDRKRRSKSAHERNIERDALNQYGQRNKK